MHKSRATGPRSPDGKLRSSLNALRHGLAAKNFILPGEDATEYERRADAMFDALAPQDAAQAEFVALVFDDTWKLERLGRIEHALTLGRIEELLATTATAEASKKIAAAVYALGSALTAWQSDPQPASGSQEFVLRVQRLQAALEEVGADLPEHDLEGLAAAHGRVALLSVASVPPDGTAITAATNALVAFLQGLLKLGDSKAAEEDALKKMISNLALPDEAELKKFGRYRKTIEEGLQRRLAILEQLRKLAAQRTESAPGKAHEYRVKLRVVA